MRSYELSLVWLRGSMWVSAGELQVERKKSPPLQGASDIFSPVG